jgi:hypothetical protein
MVCCNFCKLYEMPAALADLLSCLRQALTIPTVLCPRVGTCSTQLSTMRRLIVHLQSSVMGDSKLSNLALMAGERELSGQLTKTPDKIIEVFANLPDKRRRLEVQRYYDVN